MTARVYPRRRSEPRKRWLLIPIALIIGGFMMTFIPYLQFFGIIISLAGTLSFFLVGMLVAELWASAKRSRKIAETRASERDVESDVFEDYDPFEDLLGKDETEKQA